MSDEIVAVKYFGTATHRRIETDDWKSIKINDQETVQWDKTNGFEVPAERLSTSALRYLEHDDGEFLMIRRSDRMEQGEGQPAKRTPRPTPHPDERPPEVIDPKKE